MGIEAVLTGPTYRVLDLVEKPLTALGRRLGHGVDVRTPDRGSPTPSVAKCHRAWPPAKEDWGDCDFHVKTPHKTPHKTPQIRAGIARGWEIRNSIPRRPPAPDLRSSSGGKGIRTPDLLTASQALYQLSYTPEGRFRIAVPIAWSESSGPK